MTAEGTLAACEAAVGAGVSRLPARQQWCVVACWQHVRVCVCQQRVEHECVCCCKTPRLCVCVCVCIQHRGRGLSLPIHSSQHFCMWPLEANGQLTATVELASTPTLSSMY
jgi:hypothetical protein